MNENENKNYKEMRFSGVELLRIIAILLICISHSVQTASIFIDYSNITIVNVILNLLSYIGKIGNIIFIICSSYFLLDSKRTKSEKVIRLLLDSALISITIFLGFVISGYEFTSIEIVKQFFPDVFLNMWFVPVYVLFYLLHPLLNWLISSMNQKTHFIISFVFMSLYGMLSLIFGLNLGTNSLIYFIIIYIVVAYIKKYCSNFANSRAKNIIIFLILSLIFVVLAIIKYIFNLQILQLDCWYSLILLPLLICLFNIFNNFKFKNSIINSLASCSLFVYCIHENILLRSIVRVNYYKYVFSTYPNSYFIWVIICAVVMFIASYILAYLYKYTLHKATIYLSNAFKKLIDLIINFFHKIIDKK